MDDLASTWLPDVLRRFRSMHAGVALEVRIGNAGQLLASMDQGEPDLVIGCRIRAAGIA